MGLPLCTPLSAFHLSKPFPDLILGSADGTSASYEIINKALELLGNTGYSFSHNHPFKGGYITRYFGKPQEGQHALQLEMAKPLYMDDSERLYDKGRSRSDAAVIKTHTYHLTPIAAARIKADDFTLVK